LPYSISTNDVIHNFKVNKIEEFQDFEMTGYSLTHLKTGAQYFHLDSSDISNAFVVHFKTPAFDNTGIFHILEHLTLCGSKKYPIRDPFMNMTKRSLNSYMNAWTGPDFTMYPFATHNEKDFKNLLEVYMDATFFPKLDYYDFLQEGWRYEFFEQTNDRSDLLYKGIVFNEMKGDMARQDTNFIHKLQSNVFNNNTYKFNSGGDPQFIPMLSHTDVINAHNKYYHPSNSKFFTYGDLNFTEHLEYINDVLLQYLVDYPLEFLKFHSRKSKFL
jgi:Zn-dependent M16 (insulinase) family peptidase